MIGHSARARPRLLTACVLAVLHLAWFRPRMLTWGAGPEEADGSWPGDDLIPDADSVSTMATTLPAPPDKVWPWLVQMGCDRAGWYSWDWLDHYGEPSAERIVPEWQDLAPGRRLAATRDGRNWFTVALLEPERTLVLRSELELPSGRSVDGRLGPKSRGFADGIWGFHLRPAPGGGTRLVVRTRGRSRPRLLTRVFDVLVGEPVHFVMQRRQFHNLRRRVAEPVLPVGGR